MMVMQKTKNCNCNCHACHLAECTNCYLYHSEHEKLTYTDSAVVDRIVDYFHRFALPGKTLGTYYYPMLISNAYRKEETVFSPSHLKFIDYLFVNKNLDEIKELFHRSIIAFLTKCVGYYDAHGLNEEGHVLWRIEDDAE